MTVRRARIAPSPTGEKIRAYARAYAASGQKEHAEGMIQAADTVDVDLAGTSTGLVEDPLVKVLLSVVQALTRATERLTEAANARAVVDAPAPSFKQRVVETLAEVKPQAAQKPKPRAARKPNGEHRILTAIAQLADGATRRQLTVVTGYKASTRNAYIQRLRVRGLVTDTDRLRATADGLTELGPNFEPLPTGDALVERLRTELPEGELLVLEALLARAPLTRDEVGDQTGYKASTRNAYIQRLRARELVYVEGDLLYPDEQLIEGE
jgi:hypothetical protein